MNPFTKIWFWLLLLSIIGFIVSFVLFETMGQAATGNATTPAWIWIVFILSLILFVISFILYSVEMSEYCYKLAMVDACGEPLPCPPQVIECPKPCPKPCPPKVIECPKPCPPKVVECPKPCPKPCPPKVVECPKPCPPKPCPKPCPPKPFPPPYVIPEQIIYVQTEAPVVEIPAEHPTMQVQPVPEASPAILPNLPPIQIQVPHIQTSPVQIPPQIVQVQTPQPQTIRVPTPPRINAVQPTIPQMPTPRVVTVPSPTPLASSPVRIPLA